MTVVTPPGRNAFIDALTGEVYVWPVNHKDEEPAGRTRIVNTLLPTAAPWTGAPPIRQQGRTAGDKLSLTGVAFTEAQNAAFVRYFRICYNRTVVFAHADGRRYEVLVTRYEPMRERVLRSPKGGTRIWRYTLDMEIIKRF